jgi:hypothetical protein
LKGSTAERQSRGSLANEAFPRRRNNKMTDE